MRTVSAAGAGKAVGKEAAFLLAAGLAFVGPALTTYLLTQVSGVPMLEKSMLKSNPRYAD